MEITTMKIVLSLFIFGLLTASYSSGFATPNSHTYRREVLIGYDAKNFYSLHLVRENPGNYYYYTESLSLRKTKLDSGKLLKEIKLRKTSHNDPNADQNWQQHEVFQNEFNLTKFLTKHQVSYIFCSQEPYYPNQFLLTDQGLVMSKQSHSVILLTKAQLKKRVPGFDKETKLDNNSFCYGGDYTYFAFETGTLEDNDFYKSYIPISQKTLLRAIKKLNQLKTTKIN